VRGSEVVAALPEAPGRAREAAILEAVRAGRVVLDWSPIEVRDDRHVLRFWVSSDVLRLGDRCDSVRVAVTCRTHRLIAEELGCLPPTPRISDLVWLHADVRLGVYTQRPGPAMARKTAFLRHHEQLEAELAGRTGLVTAGKDWVLCRRLVASPSRAANYGWHLPRGGRPGVTPGVRVVQPLGLVHDLDHVDYSQFCRLVRRRGELDGGEVDLVDVLANEALASLLSHEGALPAGEILPRDRS
jgi:hypothetical protein